MIAADFGRWILKALFQVGVFRSWDPRPNRAAARSVGSSAALPTIATSLQTRGPNHEAPSTMTASLTASSGGLASLPFSQKPHGDRASYPDTDGRQSLPSREAGDPGVRAVSGGVVPLQRVATAGVDGSVPRKRRFARVPNLFAGSAGPRGLEARTGCQAGSASCAFDPIGLFRPPRVGRRGSAALPRILLGEDRSACGVSDGNNSLERAAARTAKVPSVDGHAACPRTYVCRRSKPVSRVCAPPHEERTRERPIGLSGPAVCRPLSRKARAWRQL
jgi:hypothetical protein